MAIYPFGKSFTRSYHPLIDDAPPEDLLTSQTPAIYIFSGQPSRSDAAAGTSAVQSITSWTWDEGEKGWSYTVSAINDPDPTSTLAIRTYWEAVNYKLQTSGQTQTDVRALHMQRVTGHAATVTVSDETLRQYFPQLDACSNESQRIAYVNLAIADVKARLKSKGYEWAKITEPERLSIAVAHKVLYMIMLVQIQSGNDKFAIKYNEFKAVFDNTIDGLSLEYDANGDGLAETVVKASMDTILVLR